MKDVRLPLQLQRVMAAEAEASREARAKIMAAEGTLINSLQFPIAHYCHDCNSFPTHTGVIRNQLRISKK